MNRHRTAIASPLPALAVVAVLLGWATAGAAKECSWQRLDNAPDCPVWNKGRQPQETATWTGPCVDGRTEGRGVLVWRFRKGGA
jgi:hypothetical protein